MRPTEGEYDELDRYLHTVFVLLEGIADVEEARRILSTYLAEAPRALGEEHRELLIDLFFGKCAKTYDA